MQIDVVIVDVVETASKKFYSSYPDVTRKRLLIAGLNRNTIPEDNSVGFSQTKAADPDAKEIPLGAVNTTVTVQAGAGPALLTEGVLNAASLQPGPVAPDEVVSLIGSSLGTKVLIDGLAVPVLYAAPNQINAALPKSLAGAREVLLETESEGRIRASVRLPVTAVSPGLFTVDGSGTGQGIALNEDQTANGPSNSALRGSVVTIYATGIGENGLRVLIGGIPADVVSTTILAPAIVQIQFRVPEGVERGMVVSIVLETGSSSSQPGVTLAIH